MGSGERDREEVASATWGPFYAVFAPLGCDGRHTPAEFRCRRVGRGEISANRHKRIGPGRDRSRATVAGRPAWRRRPRWSPRRRSRCGSRWGTIGRGSGRAAGRARVRAAGAVRPPVRWSQTNRYLCIRGLRKIGDTGCPALSGGNPPAGCLPRPVPAFARTPPPGRWGVSRRCPDGPNGPSSDRGRSRGHRQ